MVAMLFSSMAYCQCDLLHGPVVINEFLASNSNVATNSIGLFEDYVELYNTGSEPVNLEGWFLSDSRGPSSRLKFRFPELSIAPNAYLIVWCDGVGDPFMEGLNAEFSLNSAEGELVVLSNPDSVIVDYVRFGPLGENVGFGRFPNGSGPFTTMLPSFNGPNFNGDESNLTINEYMASNSATASDAFGDYDDWIEIYNNGSTSVNMSGFMLSDDHNEPEKFIFPAGTLLAPDEYLIVWADNDSLQGALHANFGLSASGEEIILSRPDTSTVDFFVFGAQNENISEGRFPNGIGSLIPCMTPTFATSNLGTIAVNNQLKNETLLLYPNPAQDWFRLENTSPSPEELRIYDSAGRLVLQSQMKAQAVNEIAIHTLNPGIYLVYTSMGKARFMKTE